MATKLKKEKKLTDDEIVELIVKQGRSELFEIIYKRYVKKVYYKCFSFSNDHAAAEDLAHDIFLKIFLKINTFRFKSKFSTWIYSITYHFCIDYHKSATVKSNNQSDIDFNGDTDFEDEPSDEEIFKIKVDLLKEFLVRLKVEDKAILLLKYQDELSIKEISEIMKIGESAVKMRLSRSKLKIIEWSKQHSNTQTNGN